MGEADAAATALVCDDTACLPPIRDPEELARALITD